MPGLAGGSSSSRSSSSSSSNSSSRRRCLLLLWFAPVGRRAFRTLALDASSVSALMLIVIVRLLGIITVTIIVTAFSNSSNNCFFVRLTGLMILCGHGLGSGVPYLNTFLGYLFL